MRYLSLLLKPLSIVLGWIIKIRHELYDRGFLYSKSFDQPLIKIGNLSFGGTGKSPMALYIAEYYSTKHPIFILSRGYKRSSKDIQEVTLNCSAKEVGDEPLMMKKILPHVRVVISTDRISGIEYINSLDQSDKLIILDDALQHRRLANGYSILLTQHSQPFITNSLYPSGTLRDMKSRARQTDLIVITKIDSKFGNLDSLKLKIKSFSGKEVLSSEVKYSNYMNYFSTKAVSLDMKVIVISGLANSKPFVDYIRDHTDVIREFKYRDHYNFKDIDVKAWLYLCLKENVKQIVCTYKDAVKLENYRESFSKEVSLIVLPMTIKMSDADKAVLFSEIDNYIKSFN